MKWGREEGYDEMKINLSGTLIRKNVTYLNIILKAFEN